MGSSKSALSEACSKLGLDEKTMISHQSKIKSSIKDSSNLSFSILDTCDVKNYGILKLNQFDFIEPTKAGFRNYLGFIPAAGAASRYLAHLSELKSFLLKSPDNQVYIDEVKELLPTEVDFNLALPRKLNELLSADEHITRMHNSELIMDLELPKALHPAMLSGESFLDIKLLELAATNNCQSLLFIIPLNYTSIFENHIKSNNSLTNLNIKFLEQGSNLSTLRFKPNGELYLDHDNNASTVPAGHGALTLLFTQAKELFPTCHSILIYNIDNVIGCSELVNNDKHRFLAIHNWLKNSIDIIRNGLRENQIAQAEATAESVLKSIFSEKTLSSFLDNAPVNFTYLYLLQKEVFHTPSFLLSDDISRSGLLALFERPLNILGQVPNTGKDVGGLPVWAKTPKGPVKMCLEMPHMIPSEREALFSDKNMASHFNPGFVAAELPDSIEMYSKAMEDFWILAKKKFNGDDVVYQETVLYEILGNSQYANIVFLEIPRRLFNPHKTIFDTKGNTRAKFNLV